MNLGDLVVKLKADMGQYTANLSKAATGIRGFARTVGLQMARAGRAVLNFGLHSMRRMAEAVRKYSKWVGLALAGAFALATRAAMKQEDAIFGLSAAMAASGEYTKEAIMLHKNFAASIQTVTKYGDEEVLALMKLTKSLGVTSSRLQDAAKMTIGLAAATGRNVESMAMYVAMAMQGEFTMLRRYIPALRSTEDATEQLAIVTDFAARGFKIAAAEAQTASGRLKQMKNALGDLMEVIGAPFLAGLTKTAIAVKDWAINNQDQIAKWAERVAIEMTFIKDTLWSLAKFMMTDFVAAFKFAFDSVSLLAEQLGVRVLHSINNMLVGILRQLDPGIVRHHVAQVLAASSKEVIKHLETLENTLKNIQDLALLADPILFGDLEAALQQRTEALKKLAKEGPTKFAIPEQGLESLNQLNSKLDKTSAKMQETTKSWGRLWKSLAGDIAGSMEDAAVSMMKDFGRASEAINNMLDSLYDAMSRKVFQQFLWPSIEKGMGKFVPIGTPTEAPPVRMTPKYAQQGLFAQRGADAIPIMASPGEGLAVIPRGMVDWMKHTYDQGGGGPGQTVNVTFNVNAIDAQNTARFLQQNQRSITDVVGGAVRSNHPFRRMKK